jgi:hypothetical protein
MPSVEPDRFRGMMWTALVVVVFLVLELIII